MWKNVRISPVLTGGSVKSGPLWSPSSIPRSMQGDKDMSKTITFINLEENLSTTASNGSELVFSHLSIAVVPSSFLGHSLFSTYWAIRRSDVPGFFGGFVQSLLRMGWHNNNGL